MSLCLQDRLPGYRLDRGLLRFNHGLEISFQRAPRLPCGIIRGRPPSSLGLLRLYRVPRSLPRALTKRIQFVGGLNTNESWWLGLSPSPVPSQVRLRVGQWDAIGGTVWGIAPQAPQRNYATVPPTYAIHGTRWGTALRQFPVGREIIQLQVSKLSERLFRPRDLARNASSQASIPGKPVVIAIAILPASDYLRLFRRLAPRSPPLRDRYQPRLLP
jgi:hypothetical protein